MISRTTRWFAMNWPFSRGRALVGRLAKWPVSVFHHDKIVAEMFFGKMELDVSDWLQCDIYLGRYAVQEAEALARLIKPGDVVLDLGANVGFFTLLASFLAGPEGRVHAFEASPVVCGILKKNVSLNECSNVAVNHAAISDREGSAAFWPNTLSTGWGSMFRGVRCQGDQITVPAVSVASYAARNRINRVDIVKMDIEGAELLALRDMEGILRDFSPVLLLEVNRHTLSLAGSSSEEVFGFMGRMGYQAYDIEEGLIVDPAAVPDKVTTNCVCARAGAVKFKDLFRGVRPGSRSGYAMNHG